MKLKVLFFVLFFVFSGLVFSQKEIKEGEWEITSKMQIEGMNFEMPATKVKQCIKKENPYPVQEEKGKKLDCKTIKQEISGNTVNWEIECKDKDMVTYMKGTITYKGDTFDGKMHIKITGKETQEMTQILSGKYIGPCK